MMVMETQIRGELRLNEPLSKHTSWRVGGVAERFFCPADRADFIVFLQSLAPNEPVFMLGLGSNLLVRDGGLSGTVILTKGCLVDMSLLNATTLRIEAGVSCAKVARFAARQGLVGAEFLAGIPGTMGGALAMNAGAFGHETWDKVVSVEVVDRHGTVKKCKSLDFEIAYRQVNGLKGGWFLGVDLKLSLGDTASSQKAIKSLLDKRNQSQPIGLPSCGSVFRNPKDDYAARLIEATGLKGHCIGKACVSEKHANFIINTGQARAQDIEALIAYVQMKVASEQGVCLETEVHRVGQKND